MGHYSKVERLDTTFTREEEDVLGILPPPETQEEDWVNIDQLLPRIMRDLDMLAGVYQMFGVPQRPKDLIASARASVKAAIRIEAEARRELQAAEEAGRRELPPEA